MVGIHVEDYHIVDCRLDGGWGELLAIPTDLDCVEAGENGGVEEREREVGEEVHGEA